MSTLFWLAVFFVAGTTLAYQRSSLKTATIVMGIVLAVYSLFGGGGFLWDAFLWLIFGGIAAVLNVESLRRDLITQRALAFFRKVMPSMSETERTALEAGTVWWDGELFSGAPNWQRLLSMPAASLSPEEQAFIDGPVEEFCGMLNEWDITHTDADLPAEAWEFLKKEKFFGMIIPKEYGGLDYSAYAHSCVLAKIASSPGGATAASTVAVPNSLGPAELLLKYGTEEQKNQYLPGLADGREIPCFALTSPFAGSDAGAIPDKGVICKGKWKGKEVIGMRLTWDKRYITLAPVATVLGLAFKMYDPDHLLGEQEELGITCALVPTDTKGVVIGRRHFPLNNPFQNGPTQGTDVFVPLDYIIGGKAMAGQGWRMLMECLSVGRAISLPSMTTGGACAGALATGAYARVRRQFNVHIGAFEGIAEALARIGGRAYAGEALRRFTSNAVDLGEKPSVPSAIAKYHCTDMAQKVAIDAMDVHGGKGVMLGPNNYLARGYQGAPIAITVEGANILTRSMIIFGQGAIRCHPYVLKEMAAAQETDPNKALADFDEAFFGHIGHIYMVGARSLVLGITQGMGSAAPAGSPAKRCYQKMNRYSANLALLADVCMAVLGGSLKFRESISARLGDVLSMLYILSATLKRFEEDGCPKEDLSVVRWVAEDCFVQIEAALDGVIRHLPNALIRAKMRAAVFPLGRHAKPPKDEIGVAIANALQEPSSLRERLGEFAYVNEAADNSAAKLEKTMRLLLDIKPIE
ncbi:MAG: acyl-CoA dehydrogenase, partial [Salinisphaeraceae bacterium]|nr:acyl-CoA dehydrogenase [Salinisphaeraceae bacterium]